MAPSFYKFYVYQYKSGVYCRSYVVYMLRVPIWFLDIVLRVNVL